MMRLARFAGYALIGIGVAIPVMEETVMRTGLHMAALSGIALALGIIVLIESQGQAT